MQNLIIIKYGSGNMEINLHELFYYDEKQDKDSEIIHYSKMQRVTKLFKFFYQERWGNEQSVEYCLNWLNIQKDMWQGMLKTASDNIKSFRAGSSGYRKYKSEVSSCERFVKLFDTAIRILKEGR